MPQVRFTIVDNVRIFMLGRAGYETALPAHDHATAQQVARGLAEYQRL